MSDRVGLTAAFWGELSQGERGAEPTLERDLAAACARGRAAFAKVALDDGRFVRYLGRVLERESKAAAAVSGLAIEDLYLACACLEGEASAATTFRTRYRAAIYEGVSGIVSPADAEDVREQFLQDLLVGTEAAGPKIASYSGKSSLDRWVGVGARRAALMWLRRHQTEGRLRRAVAADPAKDDPSVESAYIKERYRHEFEQALREALTRLPERDRVVLRLCLVNGVSVAKIGTMYKVSQSTVSRWLAAARSALLDDVKETLRRRLGTTSSSELASLARMVASRLDLTLPSFLKQS